MKKVITYGTFDLFHYGHMKLLESLPFKNKSHFNYQIKKHMASL
ncbi:MULTISPECIES: adenylyltransferase/cytidyltransferase family protein [Bacillus]|nr:MULTISPECIES: adenylyltransferase/cytidyltransferase family protein [Bacillus]AKE25379.1 hypothetical protein BsLM_3582 [Bacillus sp. LM 4-2]AWX23033.1 hypothetical protein CXF51_20005 [Bacillus subtilis subsp. subtilis]MBT1088538.1 adenylyltransferase/cytidyltransferase family protein [Bacillus subtilis]MBT2223769.1 adenylyltransferase/cytidyltransferase family protein [Bacillus subtilis]MCA4142711.1 adenylyltransferase/cytidyltransferase family protein [Bacillus subtilis]